jgi:aminopeptidase N
VLKHIIYIFVILTTCNLGFAQNAFDADMFAFGKHCSRNFIENKSTANNNDKMNNYDISYHRFEWYVNPEVDTISGCVTTYFETLNQNTDSIFFNLTCKLTVDSVLNNNIRVLHSHTNDQLCITLPNNACFKTFDSVSIYYHGNPVARWFNAFNIGTHDGVAVLWTVSEPYGSSQWFPTKNDLTDKIDSVDIFVSTPAQYSTASIGLLQWDTISQETNIRTCFWKHRYPIAAYLIGIASTNYSVFNQYHVFSNNDTLLIQNYVYPEDSALQHYIANTMTKVYQLFEEYYGDYPFMNEKYGHAQCGFAGGMEHQTMTFIGGIFSLHVLAHELAHHWFGNMITCGSWHDIWLNEGFASYSTLLMYEKLDNGIWWQPCKEQVVRNITSKPDGSVYCYDTTDPRRIFDNRLTYEKSTYVLHTLRWIIGDSAFFAAVKNYLNDTTLRYKFAMSEDLINHFQNAANTDLEWYFNDWLYNEGYPSYNITLRQIAQNEYTINFVQTQSHHSVDFFKLPLPIKIFGNNNDTLMVFDNTVNNQTFNIITDFTIDSIQFDPDKWLVTANNSINYILSKDIEKSKIEIYPNPCSNYFHIKNIDLEKHNLNIYSSNGTRLNYSLEKKSNLSYMVNIRNATSGIYIISITDRNNKTVLSKKVSVK